MECDPPVPLSGNRYATVLRPKLNTMYCSNLRYLLEFR